MIISTIKSLRWADFFVYVVVDPRTLYRQINKNDPKPFALSFIVPAIIAIIDIISFSLLSRESYFFYYKISYGWIFMFIYILLKIIIACSLMDLSAQFLGFKGNIREIVSLFNFSLFPQTFILPLVIVFKVLNFAPLFFYMFFSFGLTFWTAIILIQGISEMHSANLSKSILILFFPFIFIGLALFLMFLVFITGAIGFLAG